MDEATQQAQEYWKGFPEAPYSDSFKWFDGAGFEHLTTCRAWSGSALYASVAKMIATIAETGGKPITTVRPAAPMAPPPEIPKAVREAWEDGDKETAAVIAGAIADVGNPPAGKEWLTMNIARMVIKAEPGELYTLELYTAGHKFPDLRAAKRKLTVIQGLIKHVTSADASKPADMSIEAVAYYCEGKEKTAGSGTYWLDLYHIRPLAF